MFEWIKNLLVKERRPVAEKRELYGLDNLEDDSIGYPPAPIGIPVVQTQVLIDRMTESIDAIHNEIGLSREVFDEHILPVFHQFIRYADLLPASEYKHHATGGGLVAHSLDVAHRAMRAGQMTHFPVTTNSLTETQQSNVQWRVGTVLAALLHDGGKILADVQVHDGKAKESERIVWDAQSGNTIHDWAADNNIERYFITWSRDRHMKHVNASLVVMERIIPSKTWSWLEKCYDGKQIHAMMLASVGKTNMSHPMPQIVAEADSASTKADMFSRSSHITKEIKKVPLSELLCDLMRHYILTGKWAVNEKNAVVWFVNEHLYVVWNNAVPELIDEMVGAGYKIPNVPEVLARVMIEEGQALADSNELFFDIYPEILGDAKKPVRIKVLKIRNLQRLIFEPEKLYSLKEHPKATKKADKEKDKDQNTDSTAPPDTKLIANLFEDHECEDDDNHVSNHRQRTHESSQETMVRVLSNIAKSLKEKRMMAKQQKRYIAPVENIQVEQAETPNDHTEQHSFSSDEARFLQENFSFSIENKQIQVPSAAMMQIMDVAEGMNIPLTMLDLLNSKEINVNG